MRVRRVDANGDHEFGRSGEFLIDSPEAVRQIIESRLNLVTGEWFLDKTSGTDYYGKVLGAHTQGIRDAEIRSRILDTVGVVSIDSYSSSYDVDTREFSAVVRVTTAYGATTVELTT